MRPGDGPQYIRRPDRPKVAGGGLGAPAGAFRASAAGSRMHAAPHVLWAIFHVMDELSARRSLEGLPDSDLEHLAGDVRRVYGRLTAAWLRPCRHLQGAYPYIFSILVRTHPLQDHPDPIVRG